MNRVWKGKEIANVQWRHLAEPPDPRDEGQCHQGEVMLTSHTPDGKQGEYFTSMLFFPKPQSIRRKHQTNQN